jgi:hypothetical protein
MNINTRYSTQTTYIGANIAYNKENKLNFSVPTEENRDEKLATNKKPDIWKELSGKHNIRSATYEEIDDISLQLYERGEISLFQRALITDDLSKIPQPFIQQSLKNNGYLTQTTQDGKRDWIREFEAKAMQQLKFGNVKGYTDYQNIAINILKRLT